jgi:hypothetical protein
MTAPQPFSAQRGGLVRRAVSVCLLAIACGILLSTTLTQAQNFSRRDIEGIVTDSQSKTVSGATVFLEDLKTKNIRSFTSTEKGEFRFAQIGMIDDYQVWAQKGKLKSSVKGISSFDSRTELHFELKLK